MSNTTGDLISRSALEAAVQKRNVVLHRDDIVAMVADAPAVDASIPPCRMGDTVWGIRKYNASLWKVKSGEVYQMYYGEDMRLCISVKGVCRGEWGKQIFATRELAEEALKEGKG